jgi:hypothetical protein
MQRIKDLFQSMEQCFDKLARANAVVAKPISRRS